MADVLKHKWLSGWPDGTDATKLQPSKYNEEHLFAGGSDNDALLFDSTATDKVRWGQFPWSRAGTTLTPATEGDSVQLEGAWDGGMLILGVYYFWVDAFGNLRIKVGAPASDTDGAIVGTVEGGGEEEPTRVIALSGDLAFGNVVPNTTATATLTISNTGNSTLTVSSITYPTGFSGSWSGTVAASASHEVTVTFAPLGETTYGGTVTVNANETSGTDTITASGTGTSEGAALYYVSSTSGSDSYDGTSPTHTTGAVGPWLTIGKAINMVVAGDTVKILAGTYTEHLSTSGKAAGTAAAPITFQAYGNGEVTIAAYGGLPPLQQWTAYWIWKYVTFQGATSNTLYIRNASNCSFVYCLARKGTSGAAVYLVNSAGVTFYNDSFAEMDGAIWLVSGSSLTMRNCLVTGINQESGGSGGIYNTSGCTLDIDYCVVTGCAPIATPTAQIVNAGTLVDGGHNLINARPKVNGYTVTGGSVKALLAIATDDYSNPSYHLEIAQVAAVYGVNTTHCVQASLAVGHGADLQVLYAMGEEIASHSWDHPTLTTQTDAFTVQYTGAAATCTVTVSGADLTLTSSNGGSENHTVTLTGLDIDGVVAAIEAFDSYTATTVFQVHNALALADVAAHDVKAAYTLQFDKTRLTTYQITDTKTYLESLVPGATVSTFCYPAGAQDATVQVAVEDTGALCGVGTGASSGNLASINLYNLPRVGSNYLNGSSQADTRARARWFAEYVKAGGGIGIVENHANAITAVNVGYCCSEWIIDPDVQVLTVDELVAAIRADHTTIDDLTWTKTYSDAFDMSLQTGSPCIDAGVDLGLTQDYSGISVPQGSAPDIGAFESG